MNFIHVILSDTLHYNDHYCNSGGVEFTLDEMVIKVKTEEIEWKLASRKSKE